MRQQAGPLRRQQGSARTSPSLDFAVFPIWRTVSVGQDRRRPGLMNSPSALPAAARRRLFTGACSRRCSTSKIRIIAGYPSTAEALIRWKEARTAETPSAYWSSLRLIRPDWIAEKKLKFLLQYGAHPHPELEGRTIRARSPQGPGETPDHGGRIRAARARPADCCSTGCPADRIAARYARRWRRLCRMRITLQNAQRCVWRYDDPITRRLSLTNWRGRETSAGVVRRLRQICQ